MFKTAKLVSTCEVFLEGNEGVTFDERHFEVVDEKGLGVVRISPLRYRSGQTCNLFLIYLRLVRHLTNPTNQGRLIHY